MACGGPAASAQMVGGNNHCGPGSMGGRGVRGGCTLSHSSVMMAHIESWGLAGPHVGVAPKTGVPQLRGAWRGPQGMACPNTGLKHRFRVYQSHQMGGVRGWRGLQTLQFGDDITQSWGLVGPSCGGCPQNRGAPTVGCGAGPWATRHGMPQYKPLCTQLRPLSST